MTELHRPGRCIFIGTLYAKLVAPAGIEPALPGHMVLALLPFVGCGVSLPPTLLRGYLKC